MQAIQLQEPGNFQVIEIKNPPAPDPGEALVRTHRMGICGTDYSGYLGKMPFFEYPRIPGHELGVEVIAVGDGVTQVKPGDRCSVEPYMNCGQCFACRHHRPNCCASLKVIGVMIDGGLCEQFLIRADKLHASTSLSYEQLALVETLAIGCHATDRGELQPGMHALIIGAGPIGLATIEFTRLTGATITVMDQVASRLEFCRQNYGLKNTIQFGAPDVDVPAAMRQITDGDLYSVVIDATGNHHSMSAAVGYLAPTGTLVYVGITTQEITFAHPVMHRPEATLKASRNALPSDFGRIIKLIEEGTLNTEPWVTHRTKFATVIDEFESLIKPDSGVIKAVIDVTDR